MVTERTAPNFFLAGAPKCGTTALSEYLRAHPNVFMPYPKEPSYFADDMIHFDAVTTLDAYLRLFEKRRPQQTAIGEASVWYLYSKNALGNIKRFNPNAKIIVMFRNPIDFVQSLHAHLLFSFIEDRTDIEEAWALQEERRNGRSIPNRSFAPEFLQYREAANFGDQLERLLTIFPREQVMCVIYDDFVQNPRRVFLEVLNFLGVPDDGRKDFPKINQRKTHRSHSFGAFLIQPPARLRAGWKLLKRLFGNEISQAIDYMIRANSLPDTRGPMPLALRDLMVEEFGPDVAKLSSLIGRDLSFWLEPKQAE